MHVLKYILYFQVDYDTDELPDLPVAIDSLAALVSISPSAALGSPATLDSPSPQTGLSNPEACVAPAGLASLGSPSSFGSSAHPVALDLPQHLFLLHPSQPLVLRQPFVSMHLRTPRTPTALNPPVHLATHIYHASLTALNAPASLGSPAYATALGSAALVCPAPLPVHGSSPTLVSHAPLTTLSASTAIGSPAPSVALVL